MIRKIGQNAPEELLDKDLKSRLQQAEQEYLEKRRKEKGIEEEIIVLDADDDMSINSSSEESDEEEDDTAELMRELEKIKRERAEEQERLEKEQMEKEQELREREAITGNPLLHDKKEFSIKKRWDDDVILKNQAKEFEEKPKKRFINDMIRSDFHRKFMNKCKFFELMD
jgi:protein CWC15